MIILIFGMHRSGTSAVAGMLQHGGIYLGEVFMPPMEENPKGFFEDLRFQGVNKEILKSLGKDWFNPPTVEELRNTPQQVVQLIPQVLQLFQSKSTHWAWKDPRLCMTFPLWAPFLPLQDCKVIYCIRHPMSVAQSLHTRNGLDINHALQLWGIYNQRIIQTLQQYRLPFTFVPYENLVDDPQHFQERLELHLGLPLNQAWEFVEKNLNRSDARTSELPGNIQSFYQNILSNFGEKQDNSSS